MRRLIAKLVTFDDLKTNFAVGDIIETFDVGSDGVIAISTKRQLYEFEITPIELQYEVQIESTDDPSDSEEVITDNPTQAIADFLGEGLPGAEFFQGMASITPQNFSKVLNHLTFLASTNFNKFKKLLRRATVLIAKDNPDHSNFHLKEFDKLINKFKDKGWKIEEITDEHGRPTLTVDISGIYTANVSIESIMYDCVFSVKDHPEVTLEIQTDDPIAESRKWFRSDKVEDAFEDAKKKELQREVDLRKNDSDSDSDSLGEAPTVAPGKQETMMSELGEPDKTRTRSTWDLEKDTVKPGQK